MNESLIKYLAGLLDADGSLSFAFKADRTRPGLSFVQLDLSLASSDAVDLNGFVDSFPTLTGMGTLQRYGRNKLYKRWTVSKRSDLEMLLPRLIKHMVIKARHWEWLLGRWRELRADSKTVTQEMRESLTAASILSRKQNVGSLQPKNHPTWAWVAGYLDGDGTYHYRRHSDKWNIRVSAVAHIDDGCALDFLLKAFGGHIHGHSQSKNVKVWSRSLGYQNRSFALGFLPKVARHSRLKRHKIDAIIHHHRQRLSVQGAKAQAIV